MCAAAECINVTRHHLRKSQARGEQPNSSENNQPIFGKITREQISTSFSILTQTTLNRAAAKSKGNPRTPLKTS